MSVAVLAGAEVPLWIHRLAALRAQWAAAAYHFHAPMHHGADLSTSTPVTYYLAWFFGLGRHFTSDQGHQVFFTIVAQSELGYAE
jgi:hypothetical protein